MISKDLFLKQVRKQIFPLIDLKKSRRVRRIALVLGGIAGITLFVFLVYHAFTHPPKPGKVWDEIKMILLMPLLLAFVIWALIWETYTRRSKKRLRPLLLNILGAIYIPDKKLSGPSVRQLRKLHFLPSFDSRDNDKVENDSFGLLDEPLPFYIQEVSFSEGGKHPKIFRGPLVRFFLPNPDNFILMVIKKSSLLYKDELALSAKNSLSVLFGSENWQQLTLESPRFNKNYFAYTNDQIRARSVLTPRFMEHITDVEKVYNAPTNFLFYRGQLILIIKTNRNMFEFTVTSKNISSYDRFYDEIATLYKFKDIFKIK